MFGSFSAFWTTIAYVLTGPPFHYSPTGVGLFALVGAAGAAIAPLAGRWADRGFTRRLTGIAFALAVLSFATAGLAAHSIVLLALAAVLLDMAAQATLIVGRHTIYQLDAHAPASRRDAMARLPKVLGNEVGAGTATAGGGVAESSGSR